MNASAIPIEETPYVECYRAREYLYRHLATKWAVKDPHRIVAFHPTTEGVQP